MSKTLGRPFKKVARQLVTKYYPKLQKDTEFVMNYISNKALIQGTKLLGRIAEEIVYILHEIDANPAELVKYGLVSEQTKVTKREKDAASTILDRESIPVSNAVFEMLYSVTDGNVPTRFTTSDEKKEQQYYSNSSSTNAMA